VAAGVAAAAAAASEGGWGFGMATASAWGGWGDLGDEELREATLEAERALQEGQEKTEKEWAAKESAAFEASRSLDALLREHRLWQRQVSREASQIRSELDCFVKGVEGCWDNYMCQAPPHSPASRSRTASPRNQRARSQSGFRDGSVEPFGVAETVENRYMQVTGIETCHLPLPGEHSLKETTDVLKQGKGRQPGRHGDQERLVMVAAPEVVFPAKRH